MTTQCAQESTVTTVTAAAATRTEEQSYDCWDMSVMMRRTLKKLTFETFVKNCCVDQKTNAFKGTLKNKTSHSIPMFLYTFTKSLSLIDNTTKHTYGHRFLMSLMKMTLIFMFSQMKLFLSGYFFCMMQHDFWFQQGIYFLLCTCCALWAWATNQGLYWFTPPHPPPVYKSRSDQMVTGMMLGLQQQQSFQSMQQHSSKMYNSHKVFMSTDF